MKPQIAQINTDYLLTELSVFLRNCLKTHKRKKIIHEITPNAFRFWICFVIFRVDSWITSCSTRVLKQFLKQLVLICAVCAFIFFPAFSQELPSAQNLHQWGALSLFHGLPSDRVRAITEDGDGILWFGTDNGLAKYDGRRVQTVTAEDLLSGRISALKSLEDGTLWIGTESGAVRMKDGKFQLLEDTKSNIVTSIFFNGKILLATESGLIFSVVESRDGSLLVEKVSEQTLSESDGKPLKVTSLAEFDGKLMAGTLSRSLLVLENNQFFETFSRPRPYFINALEPDGAGGLWLGARADETGSGLFLLKDITRPQRVGESMGNVSAVKIDEKGDIWVGTDKNGVYRFRGVRQLEHFTFENTAGGLRSNVIFSLLADREGVIWCGTDKGISRFDPYSPFNQAISEDSNSNFVRTIFQTAGGKILAGTNRGLFVFDNELKVWQLVENFPKRAVYTIAEDVSGKLIIGTSTNFYQNVDLTRPVSETVDSRKDSKDTGKDSVEAASVRQTANFQGKTYLAYFGRGLARLDETPITLFPENTNLRDAMSLYPEGDKTLWIGTTRNGVFKFDGKTISQENALDALRGAVIRDIDGAKDGSVWFATDRGIFVFRNNELQVVSNEQNVRRFSVLGNEIWGATDGSGLLHIKPDETFGWLVSNLNVEQGLSSQKAFAVLPVRDGGSGAETLLIGTNRGLVRYQPNSTAPLVIPTRILSQRLHTAAELLQTIDLDYPQNSLALEVTGLSSRTFPEQFQYAFILRDGRGNIVQQKLSNDSQFLMENLRPDTYSVEVRSFNQDLLASEPLKFSFKIARAPFPWTSTALGILLTVAIIALIWATSERYQIIRKNREITKARLDLANEAERERKRIARDLHDQTLADLRHLMLMSDKMPSENGTFRSEIESVSDEIRRICEDLSPSVLENVGLTAALEFLLGNTVANYKFICEEGLEERLDFSPNVQMQIYRIAQEILNNVKRHAQATLVEMKITDSVEHGFTLGIENDGREFEPENKTQTGRGLSNIKSRANLIEAEISWQTRDEGGMSFLLRKK